MEKTIKVSTIPSKVGKNVFAFKYLTFFHNPNINNKVPNISPPNVCHQIILGWNNPLERYRRDCRLMALTAFIDPSMQTRPKDWGFHHASRQEAAYENGISNWYNRVPILY